MTEVLYKSILLLILLPCLLLSPLNNSTFLRATRIKELSTSCEMPVPDLATGLNYPAFCIHPHILIRPQIPGKNYLFIKPLNKLSAQHPTTPPLKEFFPRLGYMHFPSSTAYRSVLLDACSALCLCELHLGRLRQVLLTKYGLWRGSLRPACGFIFQPR